MDRKKSLNIGVTRFTKTAVIITALAILICGVSYAGPLTVVSTSPANLSTDVSRDTDISVTFDQEIDLSSLYTYKSTIDNKTYATNVFKINNISICGAGGHSVRFDPLMKTATWTNNGDLDYGETITVSLPIRTTSSLPDLEEVRSVMGETMGNGYQFSFTTQYDPAPPFVYSAPELVDGDYHMNEKLYFTFSEKMDVSTINSTNVVISDETGTAVGTVTQYVVLGTESFCFTPTTDLNPNATYTLTIKKEVEDLGGQSMSSDFSTNFTTNNKTFVRIISSSPEQYAAQVPLDSSFSITFDRAMEPTSFDEYVWLASDGYGCDDVYVPGFTSYDSNTNTVTFKPARNLLIGCNYYVYVWKNVSSVNWENMEDSYFLYFTTGFSHYLHPVPTLSEWGLIIMVTAMIGYALTRRESFGSASP